MRAIERVYFKNNKWETFYQDYEHINWDEVEHAWDVYWFKFLYCTQITNGETKNIKAWMIQETMEN